MCMLQSSVKESGKETSYIYYMIFMLYAHANI